MHIHKKYAIICGFTYDNNDRLLLLFWFLFQDPNYNNKLSINFSVVAWHDDCSLLPKALWDTNKFNYITAGVPSEDREEIGGGGVGQLFVSFKEPTYTNDFKALLKQILTFDESTHVMLDACDPHDEESGGSFSATMLVSVMKMARKREGYTFLSFGECQDQNIVRLVWEKIQKMEEEMDNFHA